MKYDLELELDNDNSLQKIIDQVKADSVVLEFGPANGRMTQYLKEKLNCKVYFVEIDEEAARDAKKYSVDGIVGDIESLEWLEKWNNIQFDYIIFADVLEHLRDPQTVLSKTKRILKNNGDVIISVPNVGHNAIIINLYNNIFEYTPLGLLDNTHTHLFAYNTLKEFCFYAGYTIVMEDGVYSEVGKNEVNASYEQVPTEFSRLLKERKFSNVYQFVFTLKKKTYTDYNEYICKNKLITYFPEYHFKIYFDNGNSWCEENCIDIKTKIENEIEFSVKLDDYQNIKNIRIDPLNKNCILEIQNIKIEYNDGDAEDYDWSGVYFTGFKLENLFLCDNDDPQIIFENIHLSKECRIVVKIKYILYDTYKEIFDFAKMIKSSIDSQSRYISELENKNSILDAELKELHEKAIDKTSKKNSGIFNF